MRINRNVPKSKRPNFAIVIDGETEFWYFQMLIRNERDKLNVQIKPELPSKKSLIDQFELVKQLSDDYTKTFWVIDLDVILKETREVRKGGKTKIQELKEYLKILRKEYTTSVVIIVNNPCLEFWLLLHFESTSKFFDTCSGAEDQLKKYLKNYEKTNKYYTSQNNDIYLRLKPNLNNALINGKRLGQFNIEEARSAISEMQLFFESEEFKQIL